MCEWIGNLRKKGLSTAWEGFLHCCLDENALEMIEGHFLVYIRNENVSGFNSIGIQYCFFRLQWTLHTKVRVSFEKEKWFSLGNFLSFPLLFLPTMISDIVCPFFLNHYHLPVWSILIDIFIHASHRSNRML